MVRSVALWVGGGATTVYLDIDIIEASTSDLSKSYL